MINQHNALEIFDESISDDVIVVTVVEDYDIDMVDDEWVECTDCVQKKMICILTILIIGIIFLVFIYTI